MDQASGPLPLDQVHSDTDQTKLSGLFQLVAIRRLM